MPLWTNFVLLTLKKCLLRIFQGRTKKLLVQIVRWLSSCFCLSQWVFSTPDLNKKSEERVWNSHFHLLNIFLIHGHLLCNSSNRISSMYQGKVLKCRMQKEISLMQETFLQIILINGDKVFTSLMTISKEATV